MALTAEQYADLTAKIERKKADIAKRPDKDSDGSRLAVSWYNNLIAFLNPERKDDGAYFTNDDSFMSAYMAEHPEELFEHPVDHLPKISSKYRAIFRSGDVDKTLEAIKSMFGLEPGPEPVKQEEEPQPEKEPEKQPEMQPVKNIVNENEQPIKNIVNEESSVNNIISENEQPVKNIVNENEQPIKNGSGNELPLADGKRYRTFVNGVLGNGTSPLDPEYQRNHQHGSFYGGLVVSDDIKKQLQEQPISEFLHFEQGERAGEHYVTHRIPEMGRHEPRPGEKGDAINYKLREYMNKATKYALWINFKENGDLKFKEDLANDFTNIRFGRIGNMIEQCKIPQNEREAFTAFVKDNSFVIGKLMFGINDQLNKVAYYEAVAEHLPQMKDDNEAKTFREFLKENYDDYKQTKHKISKVIMQPKNNDTFLNFCDCEVTDHFLQTMKPCVNNYRRHKNLDELDIRTVRVDFPKIDEPTVTRTFLYHVMSAAKVTLNGQQYTMTMESTAPPAGKIFYHPNENPQALGLYHNVDEINQAYANKENYTRHFSSEYENEIFTQLKEMRYKPNELANPDKPYNFSNFAKDPVLGAIKGRAPQAQEASNTVAQQIQKLQEFSKRIADSQKSLLGSSSTEFKDLQRKVNDCLAFMQQRKRNSPLYLGAGEKETAERLAGLSKYARAYLGIKQDKDGEKKSLNARGKIRYDLASELKEFAEQFEPKPPIAGVTPANHAEGMKMLERFCVQMKNTEGMLKEHPSLEQAKFDDFSLAVKGLREIENMNSTKKLSTKTRKSAVNRLIKRAETYIDAEKIAAEKAGKELSAESKIRIDVAEKLRGFASGFKNVLPNEEVKSLKNKVAANDLKLPKINTVL